MSIKVKPALAGLCVCSGFKAWYLGLGEMFSPIDCWPGDEQFLLWVSN